MIINGQYFHTIWADENHPEIIKVIDQQKLPWKFSIKSLETFNDAFRAIQEMTVRGAPLIGVTAAYGIYLGLIKFENKESLPEYISQLCSTMKTARPTAINLAFTVDRMKLALENTDTIEISKRIAFDTAKKLKHDEIDFCSRIGDHGLVLIDEISKKKGGMPVNILTHCNAGWLACIDWGTALAPIYKAHKKGIPVHVWVDETRPKNQGSRLTAFELQQEGVPHTVITDNAGGHLMQHGLVDMVLVGSDRTTRSGDVCNKIGTYLKALAAFDNNIPFYAAFTTSSFDFSIFDGLKEIPIEERDGDEVKFIEGKSGKVQVVPDDSKIFNVGFDVTPARLITALITEKGICEPSVAEIEKLFGI
jgi:methylthioribose-1-phosphate isomerase